MDGKEIIDKIIVGRVEPYIYAFKTNTVPNYLKIGDTYRPVSIRLNEWKAFFPDLIEEYKEKAMINSNVFFRDYAVHKYMEEELGKVRLLKNSLTNDIYYSNEFFENATDKDVKEAIEDIKDSYEKNDNKYQYYDAKTNLPETFQFIREEKEWEARPNQKEAIKNFKQAIENGRKNLLMYAVMRFGKSFTSMMCAKEMKAKLVVIVSAKADVKLEWKKTVEQPRNFEEYSFISSDELVRNNHEVTERLEAGKKVVVFLTLQDLQGELIKDKHEDIFQNKIDLLIVDETHFGARAERYGKILETSKYLNDIKDKYISEEDTITELDKGLKILDVDMTLHLSGTPYRILMGSEFEKEDIISFCQFSDIVKEEEKWNDEYILNDDTKEWDNPYFGFPQMVRFAFNPSKSAREKLREYKTNGYTYAFSALFKPKSISKSNNGLHKIFENEKEILELFEVIDGSESDENVLGFLNYDKIKEGKMCRHIVCVLPYCASCDALEELINTNRKKFKNLNDYKIINISGTDISREYKTVDKIKKTIKECEANGIKTLTLTVNRMLTGSTVEEWDTMIYLKDTSSPQEYDQAIFRLQNQYIKEYIDDKGNSIKYNMKPQTLLVDFDPYRMFTLQEQKSKIYNVNIEEAGNSLLEERLKNELRISPIITMNKNKIIEIQPNNIMEAVSEYSKDKGVMDEVNDIPIDLKLLDYEEIKNIIDKQAELGSNKGLSVDNTNDENGDDFDIPSPETSDNSLNENKNMNIDDENEENEKGKINYEKKIRTYFARILFYSFLTKTNVISLSQIVQSISDDDNKRIARNLGLNDKILKLMNDNMDEFKLSQLDYKIQNINQLATDQTLKPIERANIAMNKFKKLSQSEIVTPVTICKNMIELINKEEIIDICKRKGKMLDIASKMGEFTIAIYETLLNMGVDIEDFNSIIFSIPTSSVAYEFTRKIYEILGLFIDNIASLFNTYDLLNVKENDNSVDYGKIKKYLLQNKKFSEIELTDNMFYVEGDDKMKFDIVVGNPPYTEIIKKEANTGSSKQLFPYFIMTAIELSERYVSLITPSRWFVGGEQAGYFPKLRNYIKENNHISKMVHFNDYKDVFNDVTIPGGINYFLSDKNYSSNVDFTTISDGKIYKSNRKLFEDDLDIVLADYNLYSILSKVRNSEFESYMNIVGEWNSYGVVGQAKFLNNITTEEKFKDSVRVQCAYEKNRYIYKNDIPKPKKSILKWKVFTSKGNGGAGTLQDGKQVSIIGKSFIAEPGSICTDSLIPIGCFEEREEAINVQKYMCTKFLRFMVGVLKVSQNIYRNVYKFVPLQDFTKKSDINWSKNIHEIDLQLYKKYDLSDDEINYIENKIKEM